MPKTISKQGDRNLERSVTIFHSVQLLNKRSRNSIPRPLEAVPLTPPLQQSDRQRLQWGRVDPKIYLDAVVDRFGRSEENRRWFLFEHFFPFLTFPPTPTHQHLLPFLVQTHPRVVFHSYCESVVPGGQNFPEVHTTEPIVVKHLSRLRWKISPFHLHSPE